MADLADQLTQLAVTPPGRALIAIIVGALTLIVAHGARSLSRRASANASWDQQLVLLVGRLAYIGVLILGVLGILELLVSPVVPALLGAVGLLGLAFGLAFQDVLKNFLSGVFLLLERPFRIGDEIRVGDFSGRVETVRLRVTVLKTADSRMVLLPNQQVYTSAIVNETGYPMRQYLGAVRIDERRSLQGLLEEARTEVLRVHGIAADPPPAISLVPHLEFGPILEARYWIDYRNEDARLIQREVNAHLLALAAGGAMLNASELDGSESTNDAVTSRRQRAASQGPARKGGRGARI